MDAKVKAIYDQICADVNKLREQMVQDAELQNRVAAIQKVSLLDDMTGLLDTAMGDLAAQHANSFEDEEDQEDAMVSVEDMYIEFVHNAGPQFRTLAAIAHHGIEIVEKVLQLTAEPAGQPS